MEIRPARAGEIDALAQLWHDAWRDAHAAILPAALARIRTLGNFRERLRPALPHARVAWLDGRIAGLCIVEGDELNQLFVAAWARGSGVAAALIDEAEAAMAAAGVRTAWLACAIGNGRAARFYEKRGWHRAGTMVSRLPVPGGMFDLEVWRYEKLLRADQFIVRQRSPRPSHGRASLHVPSNEEAPAMMTVTRPRPDRVDVVLEGKLDATGMRAALDELARQSEGIERGSMLYVVGDFDFPSLGAIGVELGRIPQMLRVFRRFRRIAVLADAAWVRGISEFEGALFPGMELKAFPSARREEAEAWLAG